MLSVFISGLSRQSGKTLVIAGLAGTMQSLNYSTGVYKPIQTGAKSLNGFLQSQDLALIKRIDSNINTYSSYVFLSENCPLVSAYVANNTKIDLNDIYNDFQSCMQMTECRLVEGANSISSPVAEKMTEINIVKSLGIPLILVINPKQDKIGDVIAGVNYIQSAKAKFLGFIVNNYDKESENPEEKYYPQMVKEYTGINVLGVLPHYENFESLTPDTLIADTLNNVQLEEIMGLKIAKLNY